MGLSPIQLLEKFLGEIFRIWSEKNSLWWSGVFIGVFAVFGVFRGGKSWWICGGMRGKRGLLTVTFLRSKNRTAFSSLFFWILR
jgi:hypothetical protein